MAGEQQGMRAGAAARAERFSPFLREALIALPDVAAAFLDEGASAAVAIARSAGAQALEAELRIQRRGLALAVALGDLAGEFSLEEVTPPRGGGDEALRPQMFQSLDRRRWTSSDRASED